MADNVVGVPIGWAGGTGLASMDDVRREATYAASLPYDAFWISQIFGVDPFVAFAAVRDEIASIPEVGTSVVPLYGRHPLALAAQARTTAAAVAPDFTLGIGPSHAVFVEGFFGDSYQRPYTRSADFVEAIVPLLRGESTDVEGRELTAKGWLTIEAPDVPVVLAAMGSRMLELAGAATEGTMLGFPVGPATIAGHIAPTINAAASAAGRPAPRVIASVAVAITDDPAAVVQASRAANQMYADLPAYRSMLDREGVQSPADLVVAGTLDDVVEGLRRYVTAGATEIRLAAAGPPGTSETTRAGLAELFH